MKKVSLRRALEELGCTMICINKGTYNYRSGYFVNDGRLHYFMTGDLRAEDTQLIMREVIDGDDNKAPNVDLRGALKRRGLKLHIPRTKQDYNHS